MGAEELEGALLALLGRGAGARIDGLRRLSGGASRETWSFDVVLGGSRDELILQRLRPGAAASTSGVGVETEAALLRAGSCCARRVFAPRSATGLTRWRAWWR
jgi:hypothetical protein